jgi:hypothetical protein
MDVTTRDGNKQKLSGKIGSNPFMIEDPAANDFGVRQILEGELLLLSVPLDSVKCNQMGVLFPLRTEFILIISNRHSNRILLS